MKRSRAEVAAMHDMATSEAITVRFPSKESAEAAYSAVEDYLGRWRNHGDLHTIWLLQNAGSAFYLALGPRATKKPLKRKYVSHKVKPKKPAKKDRSRYSEGSKKAWATRRAKQAAAAADGQQYHPSMEQVTP